MRSLRVYVDTSVFGGVFDIAYATIYACGGIISWNFLHMVKLNKMVRYNMINAENGCSQLFIASPKEVKEHENP